MERRTFLGGALAGVMAAERHEADLPDFSNCGYAGGGVRIPDAEVRLELTPESGDATERIQAAIDKVAGLPIERRGAVLLRKGRYEVGGTLRIGASGVVLRGEGKVRTAQCCSPRGRGSARWSR